MSSTSREESLASRYGLRNIQQSWLRLTESYRIENLPTQIARRDLSSMCDGTIPFDISTVDKHVLDMPALVQVEDVINIAADDPRGRASGPCTLLLRLSDGLQSFGAVELFPMRGRVSVRTTPGTKLKLKPGALFYHGRAMLAPDTVEVVGGQLMASSNVWGDSYEAKVTEQLLAANLRPPGAVSFDALVSGPSAAPAAANAPIVGLGGIADLAEENADGDDASFWLEAVAAEDARTTSAPVGTGGLGAGSIARGDAPRGSAGDPDLPLQDRVGVGRPAPSGAAPVAEMETPVLDLVSPPRSPAGERQGPVGSSNGGRSTEVVVEQQGCEISVPPVPDSEEDMPAHVSRRFGRARVPAHAPTAGDAPSSYRAGSVRFDARVGREGRPGPLSYLSELDGGNAMRKKTAYVVRGFVSEKPRLVGSDELALHVEDGSGSSLKAPLQDSLSVVGDGMTVDDLDDLETTNRVHLRNWRAGYRRRGRMLHGFFTFKQVFGGQVKITGVGDEPPEGVDAFVDNFSASVERRLRCLPSTQ